MAWYYGTFSCGHEGRVNLIGPTKTREWRAERRFEGLCPECYKKHLEEEREKENQKAVEESKEMELPELTGSEKQVAWANTLRLRFIERFEDEFKNLNKKEIHFIVERILSNRDDFSKKEIKDMLEKIDDILEYILTTKTKAKYFIDNRDFGERELANVYKEMKAKEEKEEMKDIINEATLTPKETKFGEVVEIKYDEKSISAIYERNDTFIKIVKSLRFKWDGRVWSRKITEFTGSASDRVAELGNKLLNEGFSVLILGEEERNKAITGEYEPECDRWIKKRIDTNKFAIVHEKNDSLYRASKKLPNARYNSGSVLVDVSYYKDVQDFAELYGFKFSKSAEELIEKYKEELKNRESVEPEKVNPAELKDGLKEILNSSAEILDDLKDD